MVGGGYGAPTIAAAPPIIEQVGAPHVVGGNTVPAIAASPTIIEPVVAPQVMGGYGGYGVPTIAAAAAPATIEQVDAPQVVGGVYGAPTIAAAPILKQARLVHPADGGFASPKDSDKLGSRRLLQVMGVDDLKPAAGDVSRSKAESSGLTLEQALQLQRDLKEGFAERGFQERYTEIERNYKFGSPPFARERLKLFLSVQSAVLPRYGIGDMPLLLSPF